MEKKLVVGFREISLSVILFDGIARNTVANQETGSVVGRSLPICQAAGQNWQCQADGRTWQNGGRNGGTKCSIVLEC